MPATPFGFCSGFYTAPSLGADAQKAENWYPEHNDSGAGKSAMQLLPTPGNKTFAKLYDDIPGLEVVPTLYQGDVPPLTLTAGTYYAALALFDGSGRVQQRSRLFGPFTVGRIIYPPELHLFGVIETFAVRIPLVPPAGYQWYVYFGTDRRNLNQRLPVGVADPIVSGASFLTNLPAPPDFIVDPAMGYVITSQGLAQPTPGTGPSWYVLTNGPTQGNQSASLTIPHFDTTNSAFSVGILVRATGAPEALESYYLLGLSASAPQIAIYRFNRALLQQVKVLVSQDSITIPDGSILQLSVSGQDLVASLNGVVILTITDAQVGNLSSGTTGFITTGPAIASFSSSTNPSALSMTVVDPGTAATLAEVPVSNAIYTGIVINNRCFVATASGFWELYSDGYGKFLATILNDFQKKRFAASPLEVLLSSAGHVYRYNFATGIVDDLSTMTLLIGAEQVPMLIGPAVSVGYSDGYFVILTDSGFQISSLFDDGDESNGAAFDPADFTKISVMADNPIAFRVDHRELIIAGPKQGVGYYNSGNPLFPFDVIPGSFAENGIGASDSLVNADNSFFWIDADERGGGIARRAEGATPVRISTHAIEDRWRKFTRFDDAIGWSYQEAGHTFLVWYFPLANETWVYDVATGLWHERTISVRCHFYAFGKHLVGDAKTATIYEQSVDFATNDGEIIKQKRISPYLHAANRTVFMKSLEFDIESGLGPQPPLLDGQGNPREPVLMVRLSDDNGKTWSQERQLGLGFAGEFKKRVIMRRLGSFWGTKGRLVEATTTEHLKITEVYADVS